ncbi:MAG: extracellular solute-binding protein [Bacilli bacterium]|jgi:arabinogalactan oligomer/maltooligosaccharide transport system substrate-binding protein|nr:extracellular solute-binding protein [Bacilli bacterium]HHU24260.1 extracellular solute-binding protein [Acholeplasmataceae bacterium]
MMKKYVSILLVFSFIFILVGCVGSKGEVIDFSDTFGKKTKLVIWLDDDDNNYMEALAAAFTGKNPNIVVEFMHQSTVDARERLKTYGQSDNGADIFQFPHDHMAQAILEDLVYPLPSTLKATLEESILPIALDIATVAFDPETKEFGSGTPQLYAVPISIESVGLYYNIDLLNNIHGEGNWELPTTMEQLIEEAQFYMDSANLGKTGGRYMIAEDDGSGNPVYSSNYYFVTGSHWADAYFNQFVYSAFGWRPFGENGDDDSAVGFSNPNLEAALKYLRDTIKPIATGTGNHNSVAGQNLFEEGKQPYVLTGPWAISTFKKAGVNFGIAQLPTINGNPTRTYAGAQMLAVYKHSRNKEAAIKFMEFLGTPEAAEILYKEEGDLPALKASYFDQIEGLADDDLARAITKQLETSIPMPTIPAVTYYWGPAETMVINIWNSSKDIAEEAIAAENSYRARMGFATD